MKVTLTKRVLYTVLFSIISADNKRQRSKIKKMVKEGWKIVAILDD